MKFPTDDEYLEFVTELDKWKLRLTCGNCGIFAYALKEVFNTGTLYNIGGFSHVLLEHDGKYYDGETIYQSLSELEDSHWGDYMSDYEDEDDDIVNCDPQEAYEKIQRNTGCTKDKEFFIELIKERLLKESHHQIELPTEYELPIAWRNK